jgi:hypothetical protein
MWTWLNANAPAIQALAGVASLVIAAALAVITWTYVRLTRDLVTAADRQIQLVLERESRTRSEQKTRLTARIENLRTAIGELAAPKPAGARAILNVTLWSEDHVAELQQLAAGFGRAHAQNAAEAARYLLTVRRLASEAQATPPSRGVDWERFDWATWHRAVEGAERGLTSLLSDLGNPHLPTNSRS